MTPSHSWAWDKVTLATRWVLAPLRDRCGPSLRACDRSREQWGHRANQLALSFGPWRYGTPTHAFVDLPFLRAIVDCHFRAWRGCTLSAE